MRDYLTHNKGAKSRADHIAATPYPHVNELFCSPMWSFNLLLNTNRLWNTVWSGCCKNIDFSSHILVCPSLKWHILYNPQNNYYHKIILRCSLARFPKEPHGWNEPRTNPSLTLSATDSNPLPCHLTIMSYRNTFLGGMQTWGELCSPPLQKSSKTANKGSLCQGG